MSADMDAVEIVIGGEPVVVPPMTFYALRRAWAHVLCLADMGQASGAMDAATMRLEAARTADPPAGPEVIASLEAAQLAAMREVEAKGANFMAQTEQALQVIAAALALSDNPLSYDDLARRLRPGEMSGVHVGFNRLLVVSGLIAPGETLAIGSMPPRGSTGIDSPQSLSPTA